MTETLVAVHTHTRQFNRKIKTSIIYALFEIYTRDG